VADCGTGTGFVTRQAAEQFPHAIFIAFDFLHTMLTHARNNCKDIAADVFDVQAADKELSTIAVPE
jgi:trans-aconitate methyltransferase